MSALSVAIDSDCLESLSGGILSFIPSSLLCRSLGTSFFLCSLLPLYFLLVTVNVE